MSIIITGLEMPKDRPQLLWIYPNGKALTLQSDVDPWKELQAVPVPPHGRLGDLDVLYEVVKKRTKNWAGGWSDIECVLTGNDIKNAPTILPAEENKK